MSNSSSSIPRIQVFRPTMEEFKNFSKYIEKMESLGAHKAGLAKIIPPEGWCPRKKGYDDIELVIPAPISQVVTGRQGLYQQINIQRKAMTVKEFRKLAESSKYKTPSHFDYEDLERKYWKNITFNSPIYGADVSGSLYDEGVKEFNIQRLNTILDTVKEDYEIQIEGVNTAYLYFGMWKTTFAWHTEDMDLYSINYLHFGAPKSWYVVPPEHGRRLERLASGFFHDSHQGCSAFLRHKMTIISPHILKQYSIPCNKITQEPGEFMITFPFGYHAGFNHGFNCAESTNFALARWIEYGKRASTCTCRNDCVKICMDVFVRKYQPEKYELWLAGKDFGTHPEDPSRHYAAPPPKKLELALSAQREEKTRSKLPQKIKRHPVSDVEKLESKKSVQEICTSDARNSDEETEIYDVNEVISETSQIKQPKLESEEMEAESNQEIMSPSKPAEVSESVMGDMDQTDNPPELKPFWDPDNEKFKAVDESVSKVMETKIKTEYEQKHEELLDEFPILKNAVNSGNVSVLLLDPSNEQTDVKKSAVSNKKTENAAVVKIEKPEIELSPSTKKVSDPFSKIWRCEQLNNGLKIKIVQPKNDEQNVVESVSQNVHLSLKNESIVPHFSKTIKQETCPTEQEIFTTKEASQSKSQYASSGKIKCANNSKESWAEPLANLWQNQPHNFEAECKFNERLASVPPHCAVCTIFTPMYNKSCFPAGPGDVPSFSAVKMPAYCYGNNFSTECILDTTCLLRSDGTAPLLICSVCKVCVHATCYGVSMIPMRNWLCSRCAMQAQNAECCLCVLRGGALKPTSDYQWAHITCAILIPEVFFENTLQKQPINISKITAERQRLKCKYCPKTFRKDTKRACVQCPSGKCYIPYHATCGYMAGVIFETSDWPEPIHMICTKHAAARRRPKKRQLSTVSVGEQVIAKHKNKRYYWADVTNKYLQEYYSILFEDNSLSTNTLPEDIVSRNVTLFGPPQINEKVQVKWTDDKIYNGIFKGSQTCELYVVEFDDETVLHVERKQIYAADEELPREVQSKMSHSSEKRSIGFDSGTDGKRIRIVNQKYSDSF